VRRNVERPSAQSDQDGFVLIGVVMFILALTILGLSLFGLSSYEGQFMERSYVEAQALLSAQGAVERAKFIIAKKRDIGPVHTLATDDYPPGTYSVCAWQAGHDHANETDSTGTLRQDIPVRIRAAVGLQGVKRMIEVQYTPSEEGNLYKRLITAQNGVFVNNPEGPNGGHPACYQTSLNGEIKYNSTTDMSCAIPGQYTILLPGGVPLPELTSYFTDFGGTAETVPNPSQTTGFTFAPPSNGVKFYRSHNDDDAGDYGALYSAYVMSKDPGTETTIEVGSGTAIWLLDHGFRSDKITKIHGGPGGCLVMVSGINLGLDPDYNGVGIGFFAGVQSNVPVILVTTGEVRMEHFYNDDQSSDLPYLSIFALHAWFGGPAAGDLLTVSHPKNSPYDADAGLIDQLCDDGYLPNSSGLGVRFSSIAGTWKELDPDNPPPVSN
jgi:hypothetical protein